MAIGREPALLERESELGRIAWAVDSAGAGTGSILIIQGPPGVGKTRLLEEARVYAEPAGMQVLWARGRELESDFPYGVARQLFEAPLAALERPERDEILSGPAGLAAQLLGEAGPAVADPEFAVLHGLYWIAANLSARRPLLVAVDDAHWADAASLRWLAYLAPRIEELPALLVLASRPSDPGAAGDLQLRIASEGGAELLRPAPLSEPASMRLLRERFSPDADDSFCRSCHTAAGGNPFLLTELAAALREEGVAGTPTDIGRIAELGARAVSRSVLLRLGRLPDVAVQLARSVALLGGGAELRHARALAELEDEAAAEAADILAAADILLPGSRLEFVHPILRAAVYSEVTPVRRALDHGRAARLLFAEGAPPDRVASHLLASEPRADPWAVDMLRTAAAQALERGAPEASVTYLRRALGEPPGENLRASVLRELGSAELRAGRLAPPTSGERDARPVAHLTEAFELEPDPLVALDLGEALWAEDRHHEAIEVFDRALSELAGQDDELTRLIEARLLASALLDVSAAGLVRQRLANLDRLEGRTAGERSLLGVLAFARLLEGVPSEQVIGLAERALAGRQLLEEQSSPGALMHAAQALTCSDRLDAADRFYRQTISDARALGAVRPLSIALCWRSHLLHRRGAVAEAEADAREALEVAASRGWRVGLPASHAFLADALLERGERETAAEVLARSDPGRELPTYSSWSHFLHSRGRLRLELGEVEAGLADLTECGERQSRWGEANPAVIPWRSSAALACAALERDDDARRLAGDELELARGFGAHRAVGIAFRACGLVEGGQKGIGLLHEAVAVLEESPAQLELARALADLGAALRRRGERSAARDPLRRGLDLAHRSGATALADRARAELIATGARPRRLILSGLDSLTPSERRVAELAAEGLTNRQIAQALFVTQRTVETHLGHAYGKLAIASRSQLPEALASSRTPS